jgi:tellurite resistance protein TerC
MRFAAGIFSLVVEKAPILKTAAYILVLNIGVELLLEDLAHVVISDWLRFGISIGTLLLCLAYERFKFMKVFRPLLIWLSQGFALVNAFIGWVFAPFVALYEVFRKLWTQKPPKPANAD